MTSRLNKPTFLGSIVAVLMLCVSPTMAGGGVEIEQVIKLAGQSPKLMDEIQRELKKSGKTISDIQCDATRLGRYWTHLGGSEFHRTHATLASGLWR